jgi:putative peptidoglycan lipid II flippase
MSSNSTNLGSAHKPMYSLRKAGFKNIITSVFVAALTYYSLALTASNFGGSLGSDAYFLLVSLTTLVSGIVGSVLGTVFLPAFIHLLNQPEKEEAQHFASSIFSWHLVVTLTVAISVFYFNEQFFLIASKFDSSKIAQTIQILRYFAPIFILGVLAEFFRVVALSLGKFFIAAASAVFPPLILIILLFWSSENPQEQLLACSLLISKICSLTVLMITVKSAGIKILFSLKNNFHTTRFIKTSAPYLSAGIVTSLAGYYFDYQASGLNAGAVTSLSYANKIFLLPISLVFNPLIEISRVKFSQMQSKGDLISLNYFYNKLIVFAIFFSIPVALTYFYFSHEIISLIFKRGAFNDEDVKMTASFLKIYALAIPFSIIFLVNGRVCESFQRLFWPSVFGTIGNLIMIAAIYIFTIKYGQNGIPIARVVIEIIYFLPFGFLAFQLLGGRPKYIFIMKSAVIATIGSFIFLTFLQK